MAAVPAAVFQRCSIALQQNLWGEKWMHTNWVVDEGEKKKKKAAAA